MALPPPPPPKFSSVICFVAAALTVFISSCVRSQLQSKLDECISVPLPMRKAMCLMTWGTSCATMERIQSGLSSQCFSAFARNQSQKENKFQFDGTKNEKNPEAISPCTGVLLILYLIKVNPSHGGQIWRLTNYYSLTCVGPTVEMFYRTHLCVGIYFTSALSGSVMNYLFKPRMSVGAPGAIFGLVGASCVHIWRHRDVIDHAERYLNNTALSIALNMGFGLIFRQYIDNWCHVGGLLGGAAFSWYFGPTGTMNKLSEKEKDC